MVYMKIHCSACGGTWEVYNRQRDSKTARICPHCEHKIDRTTWEGKILPAFQTVGAANMALATDSTDKHLAEFTVDFIADTRFQNAAAAELLEQLDRLQSAIGYMQETLCD